jgi:hypothetical protein
VADGIEEVMSMLWTVVVITLFLWVLGVGTSHMMAGYIHILFLLAFVAAVARLIQKRGVA